MKDTTAILFDYSNPAAIYKALNSLTNIDSRLHAIIVLQDPKMPAIKWSSKLKFVTTDSNDYGQLLNNIISQINTTYILFLHGTNYLSPTVQPDSLKLPDAKNVLGTYHHTRNSFIQLPVFIRTSLLKKEKLLSLDQLPFTEALLPAWLANVESKQQLMKEELVKQSSINRSANTMQKERIMQKYQLKKTKTNHPSISVVISTYNMEKYLKTAVTSCLLQNEMFDQILIMDDGSMDNSYQQIMRLYDKKQITIFHKQNEGKARALNDLLSHVTSDFILELDADDWLDPDACTVIKRHVANIPKEVSVLYGNLRKWKQIAGDVLFKKVAKGVAVNGTTALLSYRFPLGPRIYRTSILKREGGFPVIAFEDGRLYEDVSVLHQLLKRHPFRYQDFTVYNVREHQASITKNNDTKWRDFLNILKSQE